MMRRYSYCCRRLEMILLNKRKGGYPERIGIRWLSQEKRNDDSKIIMETDEEEQNRELGALLSHLGQGIQVRNIKNPQHYNSQESMDFTKTIKDRMMNQKSAPKPTFKRSDLGDAFNTKDPEKSLLNIGIKKEDIEILLKYYSKPDILK